MCACSHDFTCSKCAGTPFDDRYHDEEHEPVSEEQFENLTLDRRYVPQMFGEE